MNERIKELAHEAGLPTYNPDGIPSKLEKFAELIVRECISVVFSSDPSPKLMPPEPYRTIMNNIQEHFGVEE